MGHDSRVGHESTRDSAPLEPGAGGDAGGEAARRYEERTECLVFAAAALGIITIVAIASRVDGQPVPDAQHWVPVMNHGATGYISRRHDVVSMAIGWAAGGFGMVLFLAAIVRTWLREVREARTATRNQRSASRGIGDSRDHPSAHDGGS